MLCIQDLTLGHPPHLCVSALNLSIKRGDLWYLLGPNGCGKTTLLKALAGLLSPLAGQILYEDSSTQVAYLNHQNALYANFSVTQNLALFLTPNQAAHAQALLEELGLQRHLKKEVQQLSSGQQRKVALVKILAAEKSLWLLDEPDTHLDAETQAWLTAKIQAHCQSAGVAIIASHQSAARDARQLQWQGEGRCVVV
jgi:heme exporter protein A